MRQYELATICVTIIVSLTLICITIVQVSENSSKTPECTRVYYKAEQPYIQFNCGY